MATHKLEEKVRQHDEDGESSKTSCRSLSRAHGKVFLCEQVSAIICDSYARCSLRAAAIWGGNVAHTDQFFQKRLFFRGGPLRVVRLGITQKEDHPGQREGIHSIKMAVFVCLIFRFFRHVPQKNRNVFCRRH